MKRQKVQMVKVKDLIADDDRNPFKRFLPPLDLRLTDLMCAVLYGGRSPGRSGVNQHQPDKGDA